MVSAKKKQEYGIHVFYGGARSGDVGGTLVKIKRLLKHFPQNLFKYNLVYVLSNTSYLKIWAVKFLIAKKIPIIHNQNGVFYDAWFDGDSKKMNRRMSITFHLADYVFYQSEFCKVCANKYLGDRSGAGEILYNAVDINHFKPLNLRTEYERNKKIKFLITGKFTVDLFYRLKSTIEAVKVLCSQGIECKLIIAGFCDDIVLSRLYSYKVSIKIDGLIDYIGSYTQAEAPRIYNSCDIYIMTKHNDPCPNTVIEALSCGLPVVYVNSGGVPELVGNECGVGVDTESSWEKNIEPDSKDLAQALLQAKENYAKFSKNARERALEKFDLNNWITRHKEIFIEQLNLKRKQL